MLNNVQSQFLNRGIKIQVIGMNEASSTLIDKVTP